MGDGHKPDMEEEIISVRAGDHAPANFVAPATFSVRRLPQQRTAVPRDLSLFLGVHRADLAVRRIRIETERAQSRADPVSHFGAMHRRCRR
jgi:hypothetical protein